MVVTFTGNTTDGGVKMMADAPTNAFVDLTFDSGSMNWACTDATETTTQVNVCQCTHAHTDKELYSGIFCKVMQHDHYLTGICLLQSFCFHGGGALRPGYARTVYPVR